MYLTKEHIITSLQKDKPHLENELGVKRLALFGSYAHNSQREDSDIDFLIELDEVSYRHLYNTYSFLERKFPGKSIQLTRKGPHLSKIFLSTIEKDLIYV
jgi:predicted nucleotidyltransferase